MFTLPKLEYAYNALEPYIDSKTMEIHHTKHHQAYVDNLNKALTPEQQKLELHDIVANISQYAMPVRNNAGGHSNHSFFWKIIAPSQGENAMSLPLQQAIQQELGGLEGLKEKFNQAAMTRFGSGWAWLSVQHKKLIVTSTPNQDNPYMDIAEQRGVPILGLDVWEHAYYLHYQNRRADYVNAFWSVVNWKVVSDFYAYGMSV